MIELNLTGEQYTKLLHVFDISISATEVLRDNPDHSAKELNFIKTDMSELKKTIMSQAGVLKA